ncbi:MAG TPA: (Fe-S)-binding protein [Cytophagaceae bacterium]|jgi:L-lactate dehydrogenase complex protein LldE|nr:(Fe-S)-binding protein [Cytophagaceae bacterium]
MNKKIAVDIFIPCFVDQVYPQTGFNMVKVLEKLGCEVSYNPNQTCCGQPAYNAGHFEQAKEVAIKFLNDFSKGDRYVVAPSASCVGMVRNSYAQLFKDSSYIKEYRDLKKHVFEFTEFLTDILKIEKVEGAKLEMKATYHDSCSGLRECHLKQQPRNLLRNVEGLELVEMKDNENCCGFGGTFAVKFESISVGMGEQKVNNAIETKAEVIISTDSSCLMHLEGYINKHNSPIKVMHIADVLASGW